MIKKIILINTIALGLISVSLSKEVLAEDDLNVINENKTESKANMIVEGNLGEHTEEPVIPEESWMRITLPTTAVFNSTTDQKKIESATTYEILNESDFPVDVRITDYEITGGGSVSALSTLKINRDRGTGTYKSFLILDEYNNGATVGKYQVNRNFVTLADKNGQLGNESDVDSSTNFYFTGDMDKRNVSASDPTIHSNLNFKFTSVK